MIRIIGGTAAGTPPDIVARIIANELAETEGWRVVVENKPGAIETIGAAEVLKQPADGQTILSIALPSSAAPALLPTSAFGWMPILPRSSSSRAPITCWSFIRPCRRTRCPSLSRCSNRSPTSSPACSSGGFGTPAHLAGEMFKLQTGVRATHVPYQALPRAIGDLLNGTDHYQFISPLPVVELVNTGKLRALAVTAPARLPLCRTCRRSARPAFRTDHPGLVRLSGEDGNAG